MSRSRALLRSNGVAKHSACHCCLPAAFLCQRVRLKISAAMDTHIDESAQDTFMLTCHMRTLCQHPEAGLLCHELHSKHICAALQQAGSGSNCRLLASYHTWSHSCCTRLHICVCCICAACCSAAPQLQTAAQHANNVCIGLSLCVSRAEHGQVCVWLAAAVVRSCSSSVHAAGGVHGAVLVFQRRDCALVHLRSARCHVAPDAM